MDTIGNVYALLIWPYACREKVRNWYESCSALLKTMHLPLFLLMKLMRLELKGEVDLVCMYYS